MIEFKRVGLSRLLAAVSSGNTWNVREGVDDAAIINSLERIGIFLRF